MCRFIHLNLIYSVLVFWVQPLDLLYSMAALGLPPDALQYLETLPHRTLTIDVVLYRAISKSESFRIVQSGSLETDVPLLQAQAIEDLRLESNLLHGNNKNLPTNNFSPEYSSTTEAQFRATRFFQTGTSTEVTIAQSSNNIRFNSFSNSYFQTRLEVGVSQRLWQDAFGTATKKGLKAAELNKLALQQAVREEIAQWIVGLVETYYLAWLSKEQVNLSTAHLKRREKLLNITNIKNKRGTSEKSDILQAESAMLNAEVELNSAKQSLGDRWRGLVSLLKLPEAWSMIDPILIPLELDQPVDTALKSCQMLKQPKSNAVSERAKLLSEGAQYQYERAIDSFKPSLEIFAKVGGNGVDGSSATSAVGQSIGLENPAWVLGVKFSMPFSHHAEKAHAVSSFASRIRAEALRKNAEVSIKLDWMNACLNLQRLDNSTKTLEKAFSNQMARLAFEEDRFAIGRTSTLIVIQAGDDAALAELSLKRLEIEKRVASWKVKKLEDGFLSILEKAGKVDP